MPPAPTLIDLHTHILPRSWPDWTTRSGYAGWVDLAHETPSCAAMHRSCPDGSRRFFRRVDANCYDPAVRIAEMDRLAGPLSMQVLSTVPVMFSYWANPEHALDLSRLLNDHLAGICRDHPTRFAALGTIPLQSPDAACRELERCITDLGLRGVQIGTHVEASDRTGLANDWNLSEPALFPVFKLAADLGAAVFVHPWDMMGSAQMDKYWLPWLVGMPAEGARAIASVLFSGLLDRLPTLRICFAHGGGSFPGTVGRIGHGFDSRPDLCAIDTTTHPRDYLAKVQTNGTITPARFYVDSLTHDPDALRSLIRQFSAERIALGSDYPFPLGESVPGAMIRAMTDLDPSVRDQLLHRTAAEFLSL
ncbi:MAG: amidohydrolase [Phycisphaeraceae bacterium]|nr:amidohydrolase [Phycisphaeraceae bacterium]